MPIRRACRTLSTLWLAAPLLAFAQAGAPPNPSTGAPTSASTNESIDRVLGEHAAYESVIKSFQAAVAQHDAPAAAALVQYPIRVTIGKRRATVRDAKAFVAAYDQIVTPAIAAAVRAQKYEELMVSAQGVMFGAGQVWINGICSDKACTRSTPRVVTIQNVR